jgi:hypothetical protein
VLLTTEAPEAIISARHGIPVARPTVRRKPDAAVVHSLTQLKALGAHSWIVRRILTTGLRPSPLNIDNTAFDSRSGFPKATTLHPSVSKWDIMCRQCEHDNEAGSEPKVAHHLDNSALDSGADVSSAYST